VLFAVYDLISDAIFMQLVSKYQFSSYLQQFIVIGLKTGLSRIL